MTRVFLFFLFLIFSFVHAQEATLDEDMDVAGVEKTALPGLLKFGSKASHVRLGAYIQYDSLGFIDTPTIAPRYEVRRSRFYAYGKWKDRYAAFIEGQWDRERLNYHRIYLETLMPKSFQLRAGLFTKPFGLEAIYSARYRSFINDSLVTSNYIESEDIGGMVAGVLLNDRLEYGIGIFNGQGHQLKSNPRKEYVGRLVYLTLNRTIDKVYYRFQTGTSVSYGGQRENPSSFRTGSGTTFWSWDQAFVKGERLRLGADFEWINGPTVWRGEVLFTTWGKVKNTQASGRLRGAGAYLETTTFLSGENQSHNDPVIPKRHFSFCRLGGAIELLARIEAFQGSQKILDKGLAKGASTVWGFTLGGNYYFNPFACLRLNWQKLNFNHKVYVGTHKIYREDVVTLRCQIEF